MSERRADLTGIDKAVAEVLDEINARMHGLLSGGSYHREFLDWLAKRGYQVVPKAREDAIAALLRRCEVIDDSTWTADGSPGGYISTQDVWAALAGSADDTREA